jgi:hypothetical protein
MKSLLNLVLRVLIRASADSARVALDTAHGVAVQKLDKAETKATKKADSAYQAIERIAMRSIA